MQCLSARERIIVALDVDSLKEARDLVKELAPHVGLFKIGLQLISAQGLPQVVKFLMKGGFRSYHEDQIFIDVKFHDIPNTMSQAAKAVANLEVGMLNVHAASGLEGMKAVVEAVNQRSSLTKVLAVTVLTSHEENMAHLIYGSPSKAKVLEFALWAKLAGCHGIICSPQELILLRKQEQLKEMLMVTPGVRPHWASAGDQKRIMTPGEAVKAGADYLVIGRPITNPPEKLKSRINAAQIIAEEIEAAEKEISLSRSA